MKVKQKGGNDTGNDNTKGRGKHFENIVRVFDNRGNNQSTDGLYRDYRPDNARVTTQEALLMNCCRVFKIDGNVGNNNRG